jgi:hypothetical protein
MLRADCGRNEAGCSQSPRLFRSTSQVPLAALSFLHNLSSKARLSSASDQMNPMSDGYLASNMVLKPIYASTGQDCLGRSAYS